MSAGWQYLAAALIGLAVPGVVFAGGQVYLALGRRSDARKLASLREELAPTQTAAPERGKEGKTT